MLDIDDAIINELTEAYKFFGISYPTTEAKVYECYYNKQREIRESQSNMQYSLMYDAKKYKDLILQNIDVPIELNIEDEASEDKPYSEINDSIFFENDSFKDEFLSWEDAVNIDKIDNKQPEINTKKTKKKKRHKKRKLKTFLLCFFVLVIITFGITLIKTKFNLVQLPTSEEVYKSLVENGLEIIDGELIPLSEKSIEYFTTKQGLVFAGDRRALVPIDTIINTDTVTVKAKGAVCYKKNEDGEWEYLYQIPDNTVTQHNLVGEWNGPYRASKETTNVSEIKIEITDRVNETTYKGTCYITSQNEKEGSYVITATINNKCGVEIKGIEWINKPTFFIMSDFECVLDIENNELLPTNEDGPAFIFTKKNTK